MTTPEPIGLKVAVIVLAGERRRAVVPTLRSVAAAEQGVRLETVVVVPPGHAPELRTIVSAAALDAMVVVDEEGDALAAGLEATSAGIVAVLEAGDLVGLSWIEAGATEAAERDMLLHPDAVLVFGRHIGWWRQPATGDRPLLPIALTWASPLIARRTRLDQLAAVAAGGPWTRVLAGPDHPHGTVKETTAFVRAWETTPPWEVPIGCLLPKDAALRDPSRAAVAPELSIPRALPRGVDLAVRASRAVARPWLEAMRAVLRRRRGIAGYPGFVIKDWRHANALEPLVPFPRGEFNVRQRTRPADGTKEERAWVDAYYRLVAALPQRIDYLYFVPWIRMGGGDSVATEYVNAVRRLDPEASVVLLTTEPLASTRLDRLDPGLQ